MASLNTLTGLVPVIYEAADVVAREKTGFIPGVTLDASSDVAAVGQAITSHQTRAASTTSISPGSYAPDSGGQVFDTQTVTISKNKMVPVQWTGDEQLSVRGQVNNMLRDQIVQAFRALGNEVDADIALAARLGASRASGTPGTSPFNTANDLSDFAAIARILDDNGAPDMERSLVLNSAAIATLRTKQGVLFKANEAGSDEFLRQGILGQVYGLNLRQSKQVTSQSTIGTGANYVIDGTGNVAAGSTVLKLKTGTGTILAGDVVTINTIKYVVKTALTATLVEINAPGLVAAVVDGDTVTVNAAYTGNVGFNKSAILLAARQPAMPIGGDGAADVMDVTDPNTGITYQFALYKGYRQVHIEVGLAWGVKCIKSEFAALLQG